MRNLMRNKRKQQAIAPVSNLLAPLANAEAEAEAEADKNKIAAKDKPSRPPRIKLADQNWIESLKPDCIKQGIDVESELLKAKRWIGTHPGKQLTQRFFVNWLNRCNKTLNVQAGQLSHRAEKANREYKENLHAPSL